MNRGKKIQAALESTQLPSLHISTGEMSVACTDSKFGGVFYLPQGEALPTSAEGKPLQFLTQINFADMPYLEGFPKSGLLQIFMDTDPERFETEMEDSLEFHQLFALRYYPSPDASLQQEMAPQPEEEEPLLEHPWLKGSMIFHPVTEMATVSAGMDGLVSDLGYEAVCKAKISSSLFKECGYDLENTESDVDELCWDCGNWGTKLGGHPSVRQSDCRADLEGGEAYTVLLFQYDFTTKEDLESDTFQFFIKPEDLAAARFDNVLVLYHNCY